MLPSPDQSNRLPCTSPPSLQHYFLMCQKKAAEIGRHTSEISQRDFATRFCATQCLSTCLSNSDLTKSGDRSLLSMKGLICRVPDFSSSAIAPALIWFPMALSFSTRSTEGRETEVSQQRETSSVKVSKPKTKVEPSSQSRHLPRIASVVGRSFGSMTQIDLMANRAPANV